MKSIFNKKTPKQDSSAPKAEGDYIIEGTTGSDQGKIYIIGSEPTSINDRFSIVRKGEYTLAKSLTESELYISGEFIHESILHPGDIIVTLNSEYTYRFKAAKEELNERRKQKIVRVAMLALLLFIILPVAAPKYTPWPPVFDRAQIKKTLDDATQAFQETDPAQGLAFGEDPASSSDSDSNTSKNKTPNTKITDPAKASQAIALARMRYQIAQTYAQEGDLFAGHLFWAIEELKDISLSLSDIDPRPDLLDTVNQDIQRYQAALEAHLKHLRVRALIANRLGNNDQYIKLLKQIQYVSQFQGSTPYEWATKVLQDANN